MKKNQQEALIALRNLREELQKIAELPRDLQLTLEDIHDYIIRNS
jgi:hypothetical protein